MRRFFSGLSCAIVLASSVAAGQARNPRPDGGREGGAGFGLKAFFGVDAAKKLCDSTELEDRIRGVDRLMGIGSDEALDALLEKLEQGGAAMKDPRIRLEAVRALAPLASRDTVRTFLVREATETGASDARGPTTPLTPLVRATAALALARNGDKKAVAALVGTLAQPGGVAESSLKALRIYPPATLDGLVDGRKRLTPVAASLLGELGDVRAVPGLRAMLEDVDPGAKLVAAQALAKLGDDAPLALAREWIKHPEPRQKRIAAEVLVALGATDAPQAIVALLSSEGTREDGVRLALLAPSPDLAAALSKAASEVQDNDKPRYLVALGRAGGAKAAADLAGYLAKPELATTAAFALAEMQGDDARQLIEKAIKESTGAQKRAAVRAGVVRELVLRDGPSGLHDAFDALFASKEIADVAAATFGRVATGSWSVSDAIEKPCAAKDCRAAIVAAAARGALARGGKGLDDLEKSLASAGVDKPATLEQIAASLSLLVSPNGEGLSTATLAAWAEAGGAQAPLAARALASRDDAPIRARIKRLLEGTNPVVRAHVAMGLGGDPEASAVSLLTAAYRNEDEATVRRAIIRGLSMRSEVQRDATLALARDLDPDDEVRALAKAALSGRKLGLGALSPTVGPTLGVAWVQIAANDGKAATVTDHLVARVVRPDGLALPVVADPDGTLLVPGLPPGPSSLTLAPTSTPDNPSAK